MQDITVYYNGEKLFTFKGDPETITADKILNALSGKIPGIANSVVNVSSDKKEYFINKKAGTLG